MGIRLKGQKIGSGSSFVIKKRPTMGPLPGEAVAFFEDGAKVAAIKFGDTMPTPVKRKPGRPRKTPCE